MGPVLSSKSVRLQQLNNTSTGHAWDEYGEQCIPNAWCIRVKILVVRLCWKKFCDRPTSGQPSRLTYSGVWIVYVKWAGNGLRTLGRCWQTHTKSVESAAVGLPEKCPGDIICNRLKSPAVAIVALNSLSLWTPLLWGWGSTTRSSTVCTLILIFQWQQPHASTCGTAYGDLWSMWMSLIRLAAKEEWHSEKRVQFELHQLGSISNFDTDTDNDTYTCFTKPAYCTEQPVMRHCM